MIYKFSKSLISVVNTRALIKKFAPKMKDRNRRMLIEEKLCKTNF